MLHRGADPDEALTLEGNSKLAQPFLLRHLAKDVPVLVTLDQCRVIPRRAPDYNMSYPQTCAVW